MPMPIVTPSSIALRLLSALEARLLFRVVVRAVVRRVLDFFLATAGTFAALKEIAEQFVSLTVPNRAARSLGS